MSSVVSEFTCSSMNMWRLQHIPFILRLTFVSNCVTSASQMILASGYEGREMEISCPYQPGYEHRMKYLCKDDCGDEDVLITTQQLRKDRYSVHENNHIFTVTISYLRLTDAGKYWCGVTRSGIDIYTEVKLDVKPDSCCDSVTTIQSYEESSVSISCPYESEFLNSLKYVCRGIRPSVCLQRALVTSDNKLHGRFRLHDDKTSRHFTATVNDVTRGDAGSYLCGVQRNNDLDVFRLVQLQVKEWCCVKTQAVSGTVGRPVTLQCPYPPQHVPNRKFLCKGDHRSSCRNMVESQSQTDLRFTLQDDAASSSFSVTVAELKAGDAGTYWCGSDSEWSAGNYIKIQLSVEVFPQQRSTVTSVMAVGTQTPDKPVKDHVVAYTVPAALLLMVALALVVACKYKCYKQKGSEVKGNRNFTAAETGNAMIVNDDHYEYQDVLCSSLEPSEQLSNLDHRGEDQPETLYENLAPNEGIYCNDFVKSG